jgi:hypothetical protein
MIFKFYLSLKKMDLETRWNIETKWYTSGGHPHYVFRLNDLARLFPYLKGNRKPVFEVQEIFARNNSNNLYF